MHSISEIGTNVPAFLGKLWKMVEDPMTNDLISWCSLGDSFVIKDAIRLSRELLPMYYKHNNMASFIRQLNMYGFHKIISSDSKQEIETMKFTHPYFIRGHPYLLENIKRKITVARGPEKPNLVNKMLNDVRQMKGKQDSMDSKLMAMKRENEALWRELSHMRQRHKKQQHIVNKLIQYLVILIQSNHLPVTRRGFPLMLKDKAGHHSAVDKSTKSPSGPVIHELESADMLLDDEDAAIPEPTVSSVAPSETCPDLFSPECIIEDEILDSNDIETEDPRIQVVMEGEYPKHFLTVGDKTIPVEIQNLTALSKDQAELLVNDVPLAAVKAQPKPKKRPNKRVIKTPAKKQKILTITTDNIDNDNYILPDFDIPSETGPPIVINVSSPLDATSPTNLQTSPIVSSSKDQLIGSPIVESLLSPVMVQAASPTVESLLSPGMVQAASPTVESLLSPGMVQAASPTVESLLSPGMVQAASPTVESLLSPGMVQAASPTVESLLSPVMVQDASPTDISMESTKETFPLLNNMQVACMDNGKNGNILNRFAQLDDVDSHVQSVQSDLDTFKELLKSEGITLDANALLGFLNEDSGMESSLLTTPAEDCMNNFSKQKESEGNEIMMYNPSIFDLSDIITGNDWDLPEADDSHLTAEDDVFKEVGLNTPQFLLNSPSFPTPSKTKKNLK